MYLLDTSVVSELRRPRPHGAVLAWLRGVPRDDLSVAAATVGEIQAGVEATRARDPAKADEIEAWLVRLVETSDVVPMGARAFRRWARLVHGRSADLSGDAMVAATAEVNGLTVATRNTRDFERLGVRTVNPFEGPVPRT